MTVSVTKLRANLYNMLDEVIKTGKPIIIFRHGHIIKITPEKPQSKLAQLKKHPGTIIGDPDDLVHIDWSHEWKEEKNL
jgi:prevent-host-death family protein